MTQAHAWAIMLMEVSSFCSHQCSEHSICPAKCLAWLWKRFRPSASPRIPQRNFWGWSWRPVVTIRCLICLPEWRITPPPPALLDTKRGKGAMGHYPGWVGAGGWCRGDVYICASPHGYICWGFVPKQNKNLANLIWNCWSITTWGVLFTPSATARWSICLVARHPILSTQRPNRIQKCLQAKEEYPKECRQSNILHRLVPTLGLALLVF